jgi:hypothetical protein
VYKITKLMLSMIVILTYVTSKPTPLLGKLNEEEKI